MISLDLPPNTGLQPVLNPPFLLITRTKTRFQAEIGPNMQGSCFWQKVSIFLGPSAFGAKIAVFQTVNLSTSRANLRPI